MVLAVGPWSLAIANFLGAISVSGIALAWTMGPIILVPNASDASKYLAIHATLLGPRSLAAQLSGMGLYHLFGRLDVPLAISAVVTGVGTLMLWRLAGR